MTVVKLQRWVSMVTFVYAGGQIPPFGCAIKDGDFYENGQDIGRVLSVQHQGSIWRIDFLQGDH